MTPQEKQELRTLLDRILERDAEMSDPHKDASGRDAIPPDGDDYNVLYNDIVETLHKLGI